MIKKSVRREGERTERKTADFLLKCFFEPSRRRCTLAREKNIVIKSCSAKMKIDKKESGRFFVK